MNNYLLDIKINIENYSDKFLKRRDLRDLKAGVETCAPKLFVGASL